MTIVHVPVAMPGWLKIEVDGDALTVLTVEVAPDESELRSNSVFGFEERDGNADRNLSLREVEAIVAGLTNESFREVASADIYTQEGIGVSLFDVESRVKDHQVAVLATVLAGFRWPGRGSYAALTKPQKQACMDAARIALERLAAEESE